MKEYIPLIMSAASILFSIYMGITNLKRNSKTDNQQDATQMATVIAEIRGVRDGNTEIKITTGEMRQEARELRDMVVRQNESLKSAWEAIKELKGVMR